MSSTYTLFSNYFIFLTATATTKIYTLSLHDALPIYVSWSDDRGWVSSQYLEYLYRNRYVYLPDYVDEIDVPVVPFVLTSYWSSYYAGRPWYHRRAYWSGYWQSHERFATRLTIDRSTARIGRAAAARDAALPEATARVGVEERSRARAEERTRAGVTERVTREKDIAARSA